MLDGDHAVGHELEVFGRLRRRVGTRRPAGDDRGQSAREQPRVQAKQLAPLGRRVAERVQHDVDRIEDDAPRAHPRHLRVEDGQQPAQVRVTGLDLVEVWLRVQHEELLGLQ